MGNRSYTFKNIYGTRICSTQSLYISQSLTVLYEDRSRYQGQGDTCFRHTGPHITNKQSADYKATNVIWQISFMMTSSNVYIFRVTGPLRGESTGHHWIPLTKPVTRSFDVFFDLRLYKRLNKQSRRRWFETPSRSLRRHCNVAFGDIKSPSWIRGGHSWWPTRSSWWTRWRHSRWPTRSIEISLWVITQPINITHAPSPPFKVTRYRLT